jgi:hypothetical protein
MIVKDFQSLERPSHHGFPLSLEFVLTSTPIELKNHSGIRESSLIPKNKRAFRVTVFFLHEQLMIPV